MADKGSSPLATAELITLDTSVVAGTSSTTQAAVDRHNSARVVIANSGADITVSLETVVDGTAHELVAYAAGATGAQNIVNVTPDSTLQLRAANAGTADEPITAYLLIGR